MKVKGLFAIFLAAVLMVAPWSLHAEEPQPSAGREWTAARAPTMPACMPTARVRSTRVAGLTL